jgi:uncharacterized membrane protein YccC
LEAGGESALVLAEEGDLPGAVLEAGEMPSQFRGGGIDQTVDPPFALTRGGDQAMTTEIAEVLRHGHLAHIEDLLKVTDAQGTRLQQVQQPQSRLVTKALVDLHQPHILLTEYEWPRWSVQGKLAA